MYLRADGSNNHHNLLLLNASAPFPGMDGLHRFHHAMQVTLHGPQHGWKEAAVDTVQDHDSLIDRLKAGQADLARSGIRHIVIDPAPGWPVMYTTIREFIKQLPRS